MSETDGVLKSVLDHISSKKRTREEAAEDGFSLTCNFFASDKARSIEADLQNLKESVQLNKKHFDEYRESQQTMENMESKLHAEMHRGKTMIEDMKEAMPCIVENALNELTKKKFEASCTQLSALLLKKMLGTNTDFERRLDTLSQELENLQVSMKAEVGDNSQNIERVQERMKELSDKIEEFCLLVFENAEEDVFDENHVDGPPRASDLEIAALKASTSQTSNLAAMLLNCEELTPRQQELVKASPMAQTVKKRMDDRAVLMKAILVPHWWKKEDIWQSSESWLHDVVQAGGAKYFYPEMYKDKTLSYTLITTYYQLFGKEFTARNGACLLPSLQQSVDVMQKQLDLETQLNLLQDSPYFSLKEEEKSRTDGKVFENKDGQHILLCENGQSVKFLKYY